jgi:hypothetical protein
MTGLSSAGEGLVLTPLTGTAYVSLHTTSPDDTGSGEVTGGSYARVGPVTFANAGANPTVSSNSSVLTYPAATAPWGTVGYFGVWSALSGGTFRGSGAVTTPKAVNSGDTARFAVGALTITAQ